MNYENSKSLTDVKFKRLVGVQRQTFAQMLQVLHLAYAQAHKRGGRTPKLSLEDLLMATLQYLREYRTYEQIAADFGIHESNLIRRSKWAEQVLIENGWHIAGREIEPHETVVVDATEIRVCRPEKKQRLNYSGKKKCHTAKAQIVVSQQTGEILNLAYVTHGRIHDFVLFESSCCDLKNAKFILADSGYQGMAKLYSQAQMPIKSSKNHQLTSEEKALNRKLASLKNGR